jgi:hypothetical protein
MAYINNSGAMDNQLGLLERMQTVTVIITAAQLKTMFTTPVVVLPAPPQGLQSGVYYEVHGVTMQTKPGTVNFTGGGTVNLVYHGGAVAPHASSVPAATILSATATNNQLPPIAAVIQIPKNVGIDITNATAVFAAGNGTLAVTVDFILRNLA